MSKRVTNYTDSCNDNLLLNINEWSSLLPLKCKVKKEKHETVKRMEIGKSAYYFPLSVLMLTVISELLFFVVEMSW